jgi:hypothetical protein
MRSNPPKESKFCAMYARSELQAHETNYNSKGCEYDEGECPHGVHGPANFEPVLCRYRSSCSRSDCYFWHGKEEDRKKAAERQWGNFLDDLTKKSYKKSRKE